MGAQRQAGGPVLAAADNGQDAQEYLGRMPTPRFDGWAASCLSVRLRALTDKVGPAAVVRPAAVAHTAEEEKFTFATRAAAGGMGGRAIICNATITLSPGEVGGWIVRHKLPYRRHNQTPHAADIEAIETTGTLRPVGRAWQHVPESASVAGRRSENDSTPGKALETAHLDAGRMDGASYSSSIKKPLCRCRGRAHHDHDLPH
ncbi:hypothetical protein CC78DRAFT_578109 [Lojkania enalia]|uniref:Uncharacterized protein n=1 Tax=Lojkania enalia TaxID=147567 RepID=A0A9P4N508_9PLEO|nr:hypothetical protein CC78DRAFT_578109 [Didymosphaeria enalia]